MNSKAKLIVIVYMFFVLHASAQVTGTFTDSRDGKQYKTVKIGTQTWMAENLAFKSSDGCYSYENNDKNVKSCGYLYTWQTATKVCPAGWHLPSQDQWDILFTYLGDDTTTIRKLKETGNVHWQKPTIKGTNESGFTGIPGGYRNENGEYYGVGDISGSISGNIAFWWSSTEENADLAHFVQVFGYSKDAIRSYIDKKIGCSVRCIKD